MAIIIGSPKQAENVALYGAEGDSTRVPVVTALADIENGLKGIVSGSIDSVFKKVGTADGKVYFGYDKSDATNKTGGIVVANGKLASSKVLDAKYTPAVLYTASDEIPTGSAVGTLKTAAKLSVTYINTTGTVETKEFTVGQEAIDEAIRLAKAAAAQIEAGDGITVTPETDATDGHVTYTIGQNLEYVLVPAVAEVLYTEADADADHAVGTVKVAGESAKLVLREAVGTQGEADAKTKKVYGSVSIDELGLSALLDSTSYDESTGILTLTFAQTDGTTSDVDIDLKSMLDINDMTIAEDSQDYLSVTLDKTKADDDTESQAVIGAKVVKLDDVEYYVEGDEIPAGKAVGDVKKTGLADAADVKAAIDGAGLSAVVSKDGAAAAEDTTVIAIDEDDNRKIIVKTSTLENINLVYDEESKSWVPSSEPEDLTGLALAADVAKVIIDDEEVIAEAFNDHESRILALESAVANLTLDNAELIAAVTSINTMLTWTELAD